MTFERFKRLPRQSDDEWQGGLVRMLTWIDLGPTGRPYRPWAGIWVSRKTGFVHFKIESEPEYARLDPGLDALVEFGLKDQLTGYRPGRLQVSGRGTGRPPSRRDRRHGCCCHGRAGSARCAASARRDGRAYGRGAAAAGCPRRRRCDGGPDARLCGGGGGASTRPRPGAISQTRT